MKFNVTNISRRQNDPDSKGNPRVRHGRIYVSIVDEDTSYLPEDFGARRNRYLRPAVIEALQRLELGTKIKWSWHAGDPNSVLSPGFVAIEEKWPFDLYIIVSLDPKERKKVI